VMTSSASKGRQQYSYLRLAEMQAADPTARSCRDPTGQSAKSSKSIVEQLRDLCIGSSAVSYETVLQQGYSPQNRKGAGDPQRAALKEEREPKVWQASKRVTRPLGDRVSPQPESHHDEHPSMLHASMMQSALHHHEAWRDASGRKQNPATLWGNSSIQDQAHIPGESLRPSSAALHGMPAAPCVSRPKLPRRQRPNTARPSTSQSVHNNVTSRACTSQSARDTTKPKVTGIPLMDRPISASLARSQRRRDTCSMREVRRNKETASVYNTQVVDMDAKVRKTKHGGY